MASALDSGSIVLNSNVGQRYFIVFFRKTLHSHSVSLHPGVPRGTGKFNAGGNSVMDQHPIHGGSRNTPSRFTLQKPGISAGLMGHLVRMQTLSYGILAWNDYAMSTHLRNSDAIWKKSRPINVQIKAISFFKFVDQNSRTAILNPYILKKIKQSHFNMKMTKVRTQDSLNETRFNIVQFYSFVLLFAIQYLYNV